MGAIQQIFRLYAPSYIEKFGKDMPKNHLKTIEAITTCRTDAHGFTVYECGQCGKLHHVYRGCGNLHCPTCQNGKALNWLDRQLEKQLPGHHFMITFTVPESVRPFMRTHQKQAYTALFKASSQSIKKLAMDKKHIGGDIAGFTGILHTWGRQMQYHPHIHYIAPGGAFSKEDGRWYCSRLDFYLPVKALSKIYRAKFRDYMKDEGLFHLIDPKPGIRIGMSILPQSAPDIKRLNIFPNMSLKLPYPTTGSRVLTMEKSPFVTEKPEVIEIVG